MSYSLFTNEKLIKKIAKLNAEITKFRTQGKQEEVDRIYNKPIRIWYCSSTIFPEIIGFTVDIHNGKKFFRRKITPEMVNHKFGEFSLTRQSGIHGKAGTR